jgi:hypothetical protein
MSFVPDTMGRGLSLAELIDQEFLRESWRSARVRTQAEGVPSDPNRRLHARCDVLMGQLNWSGCALRDSGSLALAQAHGISVPEGVIAEANRVIR